VSGEISAAVVSTTSGCDRVHGWIIWVVTNTKFDNEWGSAPFIKALALNPNDASHEVYKADSIDWKDKSFHQDLEVKQQWISYEQDYYWSATQFVATQLVNIFPEKIVWLSNGQRKKASANSYGGNYLSKHSILT